VPNWLLPVLSFLGAILVNCIIVAFLAGKVSEKINNVVAQRKEDRDGWKNALDALSMEIRAGNDAVNRLSSSLTVLQTQSADDDDIPERVRKLELDFAAIADHDERIQRLEHPSRSQRQRR